MNYFKRTLRTVVSVLAIAALAAAVFTGAAVSSAAPRTGGSAETYDVSTTAVRSGASTATSASSVFSGVINLVSEKGADLLKDALPTIGDFIGSKIFDFFGIDYTDSFTKELQKVNDRLTNIEKDLKDILSAMKKSESATVIDSFFNSVDTFADRVSGLYAGYNSLMRDELEGGKYYNDPTAAAEAEQKFYDGNLKNLVFGSASSSGDLYQQLMSLARKVTAPSATSTLTLMEHYDATYKYRWAFDIQSFAPKADFIGYTCSNLLQGVILYAFDNSLATREAESTGDNATVTTLAKYWENVSEAVNAAFDYLKGEIDSLDSLISSREANNSALHYATNTLVSRYLYTGRMMNSSKLADPSNHFQYLSSRYATSQKTDRWYVNYALSATAIADSVRSEFAAYKVNYHKSSSFTLSDYLRETGFTCDNWNNAGLYESQSYTHKGSRVTNEHSYLYVRYVGSDGSDRNLCYAHVDWKVLGSPRRTYSSGYDSLFMAFVGVNGVLIGSYSGIEYGKGTLANSVAGCVKSYYSYSKMTGKMGKVR